MTIFETRTERLLVLIEQFKLSLKAGDSIENTIKKSAVFYTELDFLNELADKIKNGVSIEEGVQSQLKKETSGRTKSFLGTLTAKELTAQKLEELRLKIAEERKSEFERLISVGGKIGLIAAIILVPVVVNFMSSLSEAFAAAGIEVAVSETTKTIIMVAGAAIISYILFSKRRQNG